MNIPGTLDFTRGQVVRSTEESGVRFGLQAIGDFEEVDRVAVLVLEPDGCLCAKREEKSRWTPVVSCHGIFEMLINAADSYPSCKMQRFPLEWLCNDPHDVTHFVIHAVGRGYQGEEVLQAIASLGDNKRVHVLRAIVDEFSGSSRGHEYLYGELTRRLA